MLTLGSEQERVRRPLHRRVLDTTQSPASSDRVRVFGVDDDLGQEGFVFGGDGLRGDGFREFGEWQEEERSGGWELSNGIRW